MRRCLTFAGPQRCVEFPAQAITLLLQPVNLFSQPLDLLLGPVQLSLRNKLDALRMVAPRRLAGCFHPPYSSRSGGVCSANSLSRLNLQASQAGKQIRGSHAERQGKTGVVATSG